MRPIASAALEAKIAEFVALDDQVNSLTEQLSEVKARRKQVGEIELSDAVTEAGVQHSGVRLRDGTEYTFERRVTCGVKVADKPRAHEWLREHNADAMLKRHVILSFGANAGERVAQARQLLTRLLPEYEIGLKVGAAPLPLVDAVRELLTTAGLIPGVTIEEATELPGSTLAAFVKRCLTSGINLPPEFGVYAPLVPTRLTPTPVEDAEQSAQLQAQLAASVQCPHESCFDVTGCTQAGKCLYARIKRGVPPAGAVP